ncbi:MAG: DUF4339 domain-containing protein [Solobacterium sp.]|jgi:hypothetical protein|nr:DUF4339 domain-containing protein [Solobacterium sp.]
MEKIWYYMNADKTKYGPFTDRELVGLIQHEILNEESWIWMPDMDNWVKIGNSIYSVYLPQ